MIVAIISVQHSSLALAADQCIPVLNVTGSLANEGKTAFRSIYDGDISTYRSSSAKGWHYVQCDFGCEIEIYELRRYMTQDGKRTDGARMSLGEGVLHSMDGVTWFEVTNETTTGWEDAEIVKDAIKDGAVAYQGFAWQSLPYGWSSPLSMTKPIRARYVRYNWNIANDRFHELQARRRYLLRRQNSSRA